MVEMHCTNFRLCIKADQAYNAQIKLVKAAKFFREGCLIVPLFYFLDCFLSLQRFMLHVPLHIKSVIDVGGVLLWVELCLLGHKIITNPLWDILATGVAVY